MRVMCSRVCRLEAGCCRSPAVRYWEALGAEGASRLIPYCADHSPEAVLSGAEGRWLPRGSPEDGRFAVQFVTSQ